MPPSPGMRGADNGAIKSIEWIIRFFRVGYLGRGKNRGRRGLFRFSLSFLSWRAVLKRKTQDSFGIVDWHFSGVFVQEFSQFVVVTFLSLKKSRSYN